MNLVNAKKEMKEIKTSKNSKESNKMIEVRVIQMGVEWCWC
jgi:hypothetical protein